MRALSACSLPLERVPILDHEGRTLLSSARKGSDRRAAASIKMNINTQDIDSDYPRSNGARNGHLTMMDLLLEAGAEVIGYEPGPCWDCLEAKERVEE